MPFFATWVAAKDPSTSRLTDDRRVVPYSVVYTDAVRRHLAAAGFIIAGCSPEECQQSLSDVHSKVVGLALLRPLCSPDATTILEQSHRELLDYWQHTLFQSRPIIFAEVIEFHRLTLPQRFYKHSGNLLRTSATLFFKISDHTFDRLITLGERECLRGVANRWHDQYQSPQFDVNGRFKVCVSAATPHVALMSVGVWNVWAFPYLTGRQSTTHQFNLSQSLATDSHPRRPRQYWRPGYPHARCQQPSHPCGAG